MKRVSLFIPCTVDLLLPEVGVASYQILKGLGLAVDYHREQTCCGQIFFNAGYWGRAARLAKHFLKVFGEDEFIVSPSGSCVSMVRHHYPRLLEGEAAWLRLAQEVSLRIFELSQFLVDVLKITDLGASYAGKVAYHESCHILRALAVSEQPKRLIRSTAGAELVPLAGATDCCGFGGEFALDFPDISEAMIQTKADKFIASQADLLVLSEPGCLLNIGGYLKRNHPGRKAIHLACLLARPGEV